MDRLDHGVRFGGEEAINLMRAWAAREGYHHGLPDRY
jgi:hypothetical protein